LNSSAKQQQRDRAAAGPRWREHGLVFASVVGTPLDHSHVRRDFRNAIKGVEGLDPAEWTPRELRHSFVSLLSDNGVPIEEIAQLVGHSSTAVTELVYRSTASRSARFSSQVRWSWITSSTVSRGSLMRSYSLRYSLHRLSRSSSQARRLTWVFVVGMAGFEPAASCSQSRRIGSPGVARRGQMYR
jgi:Phage integrase family